MKKLLIVLGILTLGTSFTFALAPEFTSGCYNAQYANQDFATRNNGIVDGYGYGHKNLQKNNCNKMYPRFQRNWFARQKMFNKRFANNMLYKNMTEKNARLAVENAIKTNFPDAKITSINKFITPRGIMYSVNTVDTKGLKLQFRVNPLGKVIGPFVQVK